MAEYAVVIAGIVTVCVVAALFLGSVIGSRVHDAKPTAPLAPPQAPVQAPPLVWPTKPEDCDHGRWRNYVQFDDERACMDYVRRVAP
jgi:hypothetical protein